jgi:hypothetical protein
MIIQAGRFERGSYLTFAHLSHCCRGRHFSQLRIALLRPGFCMSRGVTGEVPKKTPAVLVRVPRQPGSSNHGGDDKRTEAGMQRKEMPGRRDGLWGVYSRHIPIGMAMCDYMKNPRLPSVAWRQPGSLQTHGGDDKRGDTGKQRKNPDCPCRVQAAEVIPIFRDDAKRTDTGKQNAKAPTA